MNKSRWTSDNPKEFKKGDIICNKEKQEFLRLVVDTSADALWVVGLVHCAFTEGAEQHPIFPIYFDELELQDPLLRLGNIKDYSSFIDRVQEEVDTMKKSTVS